MKNVFKLIQIPLAAVVLFAGCCTTGSQKPGGANGGAGTGDGIKLEDAMASIGRGLHDMKDAEDGVRTGLLPDTITITLNVAVTKSASNGVSGGLNLSVPVSAGASAGANVSGSHSSSDSSQAANTITITFKNIMFAGASTGNAGSNQSSSNTVPKSPGGEAGSTNPPPASVTSSMPLLKDPDTAIRMLTWINTNEVGGTYLSQQAMDSNQNHITNHTNWGGTLSVPDLDMKKGE